MYIDNNSNKSNKGVNNDENELAFVNRFTRKIKNDIKSEVFSPKEANQSQYADCEIIYDNQHVIIEAKLLRDTRNNSVAFNTLLGELLLARNKKRHIESSHQECFGILIPEESYCVFKGLLKKYNKGDLCAFAKNFNIRYLFRMDNMCKYYVVDLNDDNDRSQLFLE